MANISSLARNAVAWSAAFSLYRDAMQFATMLILVRLLDPAVYGHFAQTTAVMGFISMFAYANFVAHTLQPKEISDVDYQVHFTAGIVFQGTAFLAANTVAFVLSASDSATAAIAGPLHVASFVFLLELPSELRRRMLEREYQWSRLNSLNALGLLISSVTAVVMGLAGFGIFAIIGPGMLQSLPFIWDLFVTAKWRAKWTWSWPRYRPAFAFGIKRNASGLAIMGKALIESSMFSTLLGFPVLGIFNRAVGLMQLFCVKPATIILSAIYPLLPRLEGGSGSRVRAGDLLFRVVAWIIIPAAVVLSVLSAQVVTILYGDKWLAVIPYLPWTMLNGTMLAMVSIATTLLISNHRAGPGFVADLFVLASTVAGLYFVLPMGVVPYLQFLAAMNLLQMCTVASLACRFELASFRGLLRTVVPPAVASAVGAGLAELVLPVLVSSRMIDRIIHLLAWGLVFSAAYVAVLRTCFSQSLRELIERLPGRKSVGRLLAYKGIS